MPKGIAVALGLNRVDPKHYQGWSGELVACENDAKDMLDIASQSGFKTTALLTKSATRRAVLAALKSAAKQLKAGDILALSYSGHGGQLPDLNGEEDDGTDETWCLFDAELVDDELYAALGAFAEGVRIVVFSDSCHSGTVTRAAQYNVLRSTGALAAMIGDSTTRSRAMPINVANRTYMANRKFYDPILKATKRDVQAMIKATVLLISGCQDNQLSSDGAFNGLFTENLLRVWNGGKFRYGYRNFWKRITQRMPPVQTPNYFVVGKPNPAFERQRPFTIG